MFSSKEFEKICTPAKLYFALAILSIFFGLFNGFHVLAVLSNLLFALVYTFILSWLCKIGLSLFFNSEYKHCLYKYLKTHALKSNISELTKYSAHTATKHTPIKKQNEKIIYFYKT